MASHRAAARLRGLGFERAPIDLLVERGGKRRRQPRHAVLHETLDLKAPDIDEVDGIACTSLVRTLVDLPAAVHEFRAGVALDQAIRHDPDVLGRVAERRREVARKGRDGTVALRTLLAERGEGHIVDSGFERRTLRHHMGERAFRWECRRRRLLAAQGWTVLEFTYREVTQQGEMVLRELARHLPR
jgi:hypothetical protein